MPKYRHTITVEYDSDQPGASEDIVANHCWDLMKSMTRSSAMTNPAIMTERKEITR